MIKKKEDIALMKKKLQELKNKNKIESEKQKLREEIRKEKEKFKPSLFSKIRKHISENYEFKK